MRQIETFDFEAALSTLRQSRVDFGTIPRDEPETARQEPAVPGDRRQPARAGVDPDVSTGDNENSEPRSSDALTRIEPID